MPSVCNTKTGSSEKLAQPLQVEVETPLKQCFSILEKKVRNLEKRKGKLDGYQQKLNEGAELIKDQKDALAKYDAVIQNLEFARDLQKSFKDVLTDAEKQQRRQNKRQLIEKHQQEVARVQDLLRLQLVLGGLSAEPARSDFQSGEHGALVLAEDCLKQLDELQRLVTPLEFDNARFAEKLEEASDILVKYLECRETDIAGTTFKNLKQLVQQIDNSGYFQNCKRQYEEVNKYGACLEDAAQETTMESAEHPEAKVQEIVHSSEPVEVHASDPVVAPKAETISHPDTIPTTLPQSSQNTTDLSTATPEPAVTSYVIETSEFNNAFFTEPSQPRQKPLHEIVSAMHCDFNFLQESEIGDMQPSGISAPETVYSYVNQSYAPVHGIYTPPQPHVTQMDSQAMMMQHQYPGQLITLPYGQHIVGEGVYMPHAIPVSYGQHMAMTTGYSMVESYTEPLDTVSQQTYYDSSMNMPHMADQTSVLEPAVELPNTQAVAIAAVPSGEFVVDYVAENVTQQGDGSQDPRRNLNPNAHIFNPKLEMEAAESAHERRNESPDQTVENDSEFREGPRGSGRGGRGRGGRGSNGYYRGGNRGGGYNAGRGGSSSSYPRYPRNDYNRQEGNGHSSENYNGWRGQRRDGGGRGSGRGYSRGSSGGFHQETQGKESATSN